MTQGFTFTSITRVEWTSDVETRVSLDYEEKHENVKPTLSFTVTFTGY